MTAPSIHPKALCESHHVGDGTRIWAFAHILPGARIGSDCNICDGVFIENDVVVGDRVTIKNGVQLWDGVTLADDVFVGPNATFCNDRFPRSRDRPLRFLRTIVERGASIGANATLLPGITVGIGAMVGAGAVVTRSVPAHAVVTGNPARIRAYTHTDPAPDTHPRLEPRHAQSQIEGVRLYPLPHFSDLRGELSVIEFIKFPPFPPKRAFLIYGVPSQEVRGEHAHRQCAQFLVCVNGEVSVLVDDGIQREEYRLNSPAAGLHIPAMVWASQYRYSEDAVLMVMASHAYDPDDYIRDYQTFLDTKGVS